MTLPNSSPPESRGQILVVDDELNIRESLAHALISFGYRVVVASNVTQAIDMVRRSSIDIVLTDLNMPEQSGLELVRHLRKEDPTVSLVMMTAFGSVETAVEAMKNGAEDYLLKPIDLDVLKKTIDNLSEKRSLRRENRRLQAENRALKENLPVRYHMASMLGASPEVQELMKSLKLYMKVRTPVLLMGEPGCQLSEVAQILHYNSPWSSNSLIQFSCHLVPTELHEAQLFGSEEHYEAGVKIRGMAGLIEKAHFGTLILSDIGHISKRCQSGLSRVFNQKKCQRTSGTHFYEADVRIVATGHEKEIESRVKENLLRWDLWEFMKDNVITIPPLRSRVMDLPILVLAEAKRFSNFYGKKIQSVHPDVIDLLSRYSFPGNYRELESLLDSAVIRCQGEVLMTTHFRLHEK